MWVPIIPISSQSMQCYDQGLGCLLWAWQWLVNGGNVVETGQASLPPLGMLAIWKTRWPSSIALSVSKERSFEEKVRWNNFLYELSIVLISHFRPKIGKQLTLLITTVCSCVLYNYLIDRYNYQISRMIDVDWKLGVILDSDLNLEIS